MNIPVSLTICWLGDDREDWTFQFQVPIEDVPTFEVAAHSFASVASKVVVSYRLPLDLMIVPSIITYTVEFEHDEE